MLDQHIASKFYIFVIIFQRYFLLWREFGSYKQLMALVYGKFGGLSQNESQQSSPAFCENPETNRDVSEHSDETKLLLSYPIQA